MGSLIRVLHVITWFRRGGVETQLLNMLSAYDRSRFQMDACVIGPEAGYLADRARELGASILSCRRSPDLWSFSRRFARLLKGRVYHVVHSHAEAWSGATLRGAYMAGVPVRIAHARYMLPEGSEAGSGILIKAARKLVVDWGRFWVNRYATRIMAVSEAVMDARWPQWRSDKEKYVVWTGGVDPVRFSPDGKGRRPGPPAVINVGSFRPAKRQEFMLQIFRQLLTRVTEAILLMVGAGQGEESCRVLADRLGLSERVRFLGLRDDIPELLRSADVLLSCSEAEGLPNALIEAQAVGLPVVATDIPPHREVLARELHPFLFSSEDLNGAACSLERLLNDPGLIESLSKAVRLHVINHWDSRVKLEELLDWYETWLNRRVERAFY
ncbi:MAG: glycosyltransferase [Pseudomonadota bacterium]